MEIAEKCRDELQKLWNKVLWADETKMNLYKRDGNPKVWREKGSAHDPKRTSSPVKRVGGGVMAWARTAASLMGSLIIIGGDSRSKMNSEVSRGLHPN